MESTVFEIGDIVVLKSGGPYMTVSAVDLTTQLLECIWFDEDELKHVDDFPKDVLESVEFEDDFEEDAEVAEEVEEKAMEEDEEAESMRLS